MFTHLQRSLLKITGLICAGFVFGIAAKSPSVNPLLDPVTIDASPAAAAQGENLVLARPEQRAEQSLEREASIDCSDPDSATCRDLRESYQRYLNGNWDWNSSYGLVKPDPVEREASARERRPKRRSPAESNGDLRVVTVFHGSDAREFLVRRETN